MQIKALITALAFVLATASLTNAAPNNGVRAPVSLKDRYIVTLKRDADFKTFSRAL
ncbi:hypothetical protein H9P43_008742 [Blastocladiella emersonii ATCC 22665]|nr:hypothetical protein H9P43_008742 [Blastocladiella emersonii ATCC 22665]